MNTSFNAFINNRRKELNMSIDELVEKSGVPKGTLSKITAGINTNPTLSTVEAICDALNCSLNDAVGYVEKNQITFDEMSYIKKYRTLDEHGKEVVTSVLDIEYKRCEAMQSKPKTFKVMTAARSADGRTEIRDIEMTAEEVKKLDNIPETDEQF